MKIIVIPALCRLPLIETAQSTINNGAPGLERRPAGLLGRLAAKIWAAITSRVLVGYEDETGFHYGAAQVSTPVVRARCIRNRATGKPCLQARWKAIRTHNLDSGRRLVLQWDSSSLPPCRLSPESFLIRSNPRYWAETGQYPASFTRTGRIGRSRMLDFCAGRWSRSLTITSTQPAR